MDPEEERIAAEEARIAALATGTADQDPPAEDDEEPADPALLASDDEDPAEPAEDDEPPADPEPEAPRRGQRTLEGRISKLAAEKREAANRAERAEAEVARLRAAGAVPPAEGETPTEGETPVRADYRTQADFDRAVRAEAARQATVSEFNRKCNAVEDAGSKMRGWEAAKANLALLDDKGVIPMDLLSVALETDNPAAVLFALGNDVDRAQELLDMSPVKRAMEIAKMAEQKKPAPAPRSSAPPPVDPIRARGGAPASGPSDKQSDDEWLRERNAQLEAKRKAERARYA